MQIMPATWTYVEDVLIGHPVDDTAPTATSTSAWRTSTICCGLRRRRQLALAGWYQGERSVKANGPLKVSKVFVADVLALKQRM